MKQLFFLLFILFPILAFSQTRDVEIIKKADLDWLSSYEHNDTTTLNRILSNNFLMITDKGVKMNKQFLIEKIADRQSSITFIRDSVDVKIFGDIAYLVGYGRATEKVDDIMKSGRNCYSTIYIRHKEKWQAVETFIMRLKYDEDQ